MTLLPFSAKWYAEISRAEEFEASTSWAGKGIQMKVKMCSYGKPGIREIFAGD